MGGGLVKENGDFAVEGLPSFGQVRVRVKFVGYKDYNQKVYIVPPDKVDQDLGNIKLAIDDKLLSEVDVFFLPFGFGLSGADIPFSVIDFDWPPPDGAGDCDSLFFSFS